MQNYHMRQNQGQNTNNINNNINNNPQMKSEKELSDEEFLIYYKEKYPEEYAKLMQEAYQGNSIQESPYENMENNIYYNKNEINNQEIENEKIYDIETILKNGEITNSSPLELFLCLTKTYNDFFPFFKRQGVNNLEQAISFKNYNLNLKNNKAHFNINFNKDKEFIEINLRNIRQELSKYDKYQQIIFLLEKPLKFDGNEITLDSQLILKSFINGTSTPNFCKMNKFQTQNLKPSSLYSANLQKFKITKLPSNKIEGFINLKNLYLDSNRIQEIKGLNFPNLEELNLADNYIRKIENLEGCPRLKILNLSYNNIHILENIKNNIYLENINLSNQYIPNFIYFMIKINSIPSPCSLKILNLENVNMVTIPKIFFPFLEEINIKNNQLIEMMDILSIVKNSPYLRKINCLGNPFILENKTNYRNFIIIAGKNLEEVDEKEVKENEKIYVNQLYNRKFGKKKIKTKEKNEVDIGKQNLVVTKVSSKPNIKYNIPHNNPYDYYKYQ